MKLSYIYQEGKNLHKANIYQSVSMVSAFAQKCNVDWYRGFQKIDKKKKHNSISEIRILNFGLFQNSLKILEKLSRLIFCLHTAIVLIFRKPDLIFTRDFAFLLFYSKLPKSLIVNCPIVFECHKVYYQVSQKVDQKQEASAYKIVDYFVVVSNGIKEDLVTDFGVSSERILVAPNGIDPSHSKRTKVEKSDSRLHIVYAGSLHDWKGVPVILDAAEHLSKEDIHFHIIGGQENEHEKLVRTIHQKKLDDKISSLPFIDRGELFRYFENMDIGLVPTIKLVEGEKYTSPIKLFEYAQAGLYILSSDIKPVRELAKKGFWIEFFEAGNGIDLANKIKMIKQNSFNPKKIKQNKDLVDSYSWENRAKKILEFIS